MRCGWWVLAHTMSYLLFRGSENCTPFRHVKWVPWLQKIDMLADSGVINQELGRSWVGDKDLLPRNWYRPGSALKNYWQWFPHISQELLETPERAHCSQVCQWSAHVSLKLVMSLCVCVSLEFCSASGFGLPPQSSDVMGFQIWTFGDDVLPEWTFRSSSAFCAFCIDAGWVDETQGSYQPVYCITITVL